MLNQYMSKKKREELEDLRQKKESKWKQFKKDFYGYTLMLWDGLGFFGTDHMKLGRLQGEKVNFCTFFRSPRTMTLSFSMIVLCVYIIIQELDHLYEKKSQTISLVLDQEYRYNLSEALALHSGNWFYVDKVFHHIKDHQERNREEKDKSKKFREYKNIPLQWDQMNWHDKRFIEEYLCNRTNMTYVQQNHYDPIGKEPYTEQYNYTFRCELLDFANEHIRLHYWLPINDKNFKATFKNSLGPDKMPKENLTTVFFKRSSEFSAQVICEFDNDLKGLYSWYALMHTKIGTNEAAYNNWNFSSDTTAKWWDSVEHGFWYANTTTLLVQSQRYQIGFQQLQNAYVKLVPEKFIHIKKNQTNFFLGIPIEFQDFVDQHVIWMKSVVMNDKGKTPVRSKDFESGTDIVSNIDFDFTERVYKVEYYSFLDVLSKLGGLRASIVPIIGYFVPLLTLHFLYKLAGIIDDKLEQGQFDEMINLIKIARNQFQMIQIALQQKQVQLNRELKKQLDNCLAIDFSNLINYKDDGKINQEESKLDDIEEAAINFISLAQSIQVETDERLRENFISKTQIVNDQDSNFYKWTWELDKAQKQNILQKVRSGIITQQQATAKIEKEVISDHALQYMIEPILVREERFKFFNKQRNLSRMQVLQSIRSRISFYQIFNLFNIVELKDQESKITQNIQERHSFRLQQLEKTIERIHRIIDEGPDGRDSKRGTISSEVKVIDYKNQKSNNKYNNTHLNGQDPNKNFGPAQNLESLNQLNDMYILPPIEQADRIETRQQLLSGDIIQFTPTNHQEDSTENALVDKRTLN